MSENKGNFFIASVKGILTSLVAALIGILLFALILKIFDIPSAAVKPVNQAIKVLAVFLGCFFSLNGKTGYLKGAIVGFFFTIIMYLLFALFGKVSAFSVGFLIDLLFVTVTGTISGILTVNIKKN